MTESSTVKNLGAVFDAHVKAEFRQRRCRHNGDNGGRALLNSCSYPDRRTGRSEVETFYRDHFVGHWPDDVEVKPLSRTVGQNRVVDELIVSFTHDREMRVSGRAADRSEGCVAAFRSDGFRRSRSRRLRTHLLGSSVASGSGWITRSGIASGLRRRTGQTSARQHSACKRDDRTVAIESEAAVASFFAHLLPTRVICVRFHECHLTHLGEPANPRVPPPDPI
jgi:hypothetical protein